MGQSHTHYDNLPAGEHSVLPVDGHSHSPKGLEYSLLVTESSVNTELLSRQRNNLQAVYPLVAKFYNDGYTLNQLKRIPCVKFDNKTLFQVILSKSADLLGPSLTNKWQLHVKRSFISTEHSNSTITTHVTELWRDIQEEASRGARLVSIEPTIPAAHHQDDLEKGSWGIVQEVDVFFDVPLHFNPSFFIYQAISVPVLWHRETHSSGDALECDWFSHFITFLSEGWKLVEILFDSSVRHRVTVPSRTLTMNSVWVFEKRAEDESNPSPRWEGVIIRYMHKSYTRFEDFRECYAKTSWNKVIHTMGKRGWELACIVTTPPSIQKGSLVTSINCKILMFFQRPFTGSKPLRRMSSNTQGTVISPIRVDGNAFPEWSILGESHLEEGRPVILPPYSERGVDIGPLESTPDRSIAQVPLPAEPPPTYAEAVAGDVTVLFSTSVTEALLPTGNAGPNNPLTTVHAAVQHTAPLPSTTVPTDRTHSAPGMVPRNVQTAANTANANSVPYQGGSANTVPPASDRIVPSNSNSVVNASTSVATNASIPSSTRRTTDSSASAQGTADPSAQRNGNRGNQQASNHDGNVSARPPPKPPRTLVEPGNRATRPLSGTLPANSTHTGSGRRRERSEVTHPKHGMHVRHGSATVGSSAPSSHKRANHPTPANRTASNGFQAPPKPANRPENRKERERINTERGMGGNNLSARGENPREKSLEQNHGKHVHPPSRQGRQPPEGRYHATYRRPEENRARKATERENHRDHQTSATTRMTRYEKNRPVRREASKERSNHFSVVKGKDPVPKPKDLPDHWSHQSKFDGPQPAALESGRKDLAFNPAMVQKRRDRDYERVPGRNGENVGMKRSKDDLNFHHHQVRRKNDEITRAKFAEITNNRPVSGPSAQVKTFPQENTRFDQEPHGENKHPVISKTRQVQGGPDGVRKEVKEATVRTLRTAEQSRPQMDQGKRIPPTYDQALMRKSRTHSDDETNPKTRSTPHNLPDLIRDKRSGDARQWVVKDLDVDEVFISSQVKPESQPQRGGHSPKVRRNASRNDGRTEQSVGRMFEASQVSQRLELDMSDRRSLDSLQSFMDDQKRKPPEYETVLAKRVVKPKPLKQSHNYAGPDIIEHTSQKGLPLQQSLPLQASNLPAKSKAPLPSYQQVIYSRSGARPKLKPSKSDQWSTDDVSRRPEVQRRQEEKRHLGPYGRKTNEHDRSKNRQEIPVLRTTQTVDSYNQSEKQKSMLAPPPLERVSRSSVSPIGSVDSFDLISQWSQDDIEPPPSRLSKDLSGRVITGESTSSQADSVRGDYALVNDKRSYPVHSWDPGSAVGPDTEESVMGVKSSYWADGGVRNSALDNRYSKPAPGTSLNCSQEKIIKSPSRTPSVSQRHVYIGKEIL